MSRPKKTIPPTFCMPLTTIHLRTVGAGYFQISLPISFIRARSLSAGDPLYLIEEKPGILTLFTPAAYNRLHPISGQYDILGAVKKREKRAKTYKKIFT